MNPKTMADSEHRTPWFRTTAMIECHLYSGRQVATDLGSEIHRVMEDSELHPIERESEGEPRPNKSPLLNSELLLFWIFVVYNFAALLCAGYVIWAKCRGDWPH